MELTIHNVLPKHAHQYTACHIACWRAAYQGILPDDYLKSMSAEIEPRVRHLKETLSRPSEYLFYYAAVGDKMVGRLVFGKSRDEDKPDAGEIHAIYLLEEYWDKGYGRKMMDYAISTLKRMGHGEIILWVLEDNRRARRFYEAFHFVFDGAKKEIEIGTALTEIRYVLAL